MKIGWVKEPILIFFIMGTLLFAWQSPNIESQTINVDRASLIRFVENRTKDFSGSVSANFDLLSDQTVREIVDRYSREEALYRKALKLGLDQRDYVIRQRLVQRVEYLSEGQFTSEPGEEQLYNYYLANQELFSKPATVTFTHVYFSDERSDVAALAKAKSTLELLRSEKVRFDHAPRYGERFLYLLNYVEKNREYIKSHFGAEMSDSLFDIALNEGWKGPLKSKHGYHLVMLIGKKEAHVAEFSDSKFLARTRWMAERRELLREALITGMLAEYKVNLSAALEDRLGVSDHVGR